MDGESAVCQQLYKVLFVSVNSLKFTTTTLLRKSKCRDGEATGLAQGHRVVSCWTKCQREKDWESSQWLVILSLSRLWNLPLLPFLPLFLPHSPALPLTCPYAQESTLVIGRACKTHKLAPFFEDESWRILGSGVGKGGESRQEGSLFH